MDGCVDEWMDETFKIIRSLRPKPVIYSSANTLDFIFLIYIFVRTLFTFYLSEWSVFIHMVGHHWIKPFGQHFSSVVVISVPKPTCFAFFLFRKENTNSACSNKLFIWCKKSTCFTLFLVSKRESVLVCRTHLPYYNLFLISKQFSTLS
jgi:hypothetical protein